MSKAEPTRSADPPIADGDWGIGVSGPRWHSRGYLPHFEGADAAQHVTFHLADSLPGGVLERMEVELESLPADRRDLNRRKMMEAWIDAGHGSCVLRAPIVGKMVQDALLFFDGQRYRLLAWVVMPNHVHVLFQPINGWPVAKTVASWKKWTARKICDYQRNAQSAAGTANLLIGTQKAVNLEIGDPGEPVWHREYWDRYMRDSNHLTQAIDYIHQNPVKAKLVQEAEEWPWSSASFRTSGPPGLPGPPIS